MIRFVTTLPLSTRHRISQISFHPSRALLAVQSHDKAIDVFRIRPEDEIRKKQARRRKRERERAKVAEGDIEGGKEGEGHTTGESEAESTAGVARRGRRPPHHSSSSGSTTSGFLQKHFPKRYFILKSLTQVRLIGFVGSGHCSDCLFHSTTWILV